MMIYIYICVTYRITIYINSLTSFESILLPQKKSGYLFNYKKIRNEKNLKRLKSASNVYVYMYMFVCAFKLIIQLFFAIKF